MTFKIEINKKEKTHRDRLIKILKGYDYHWQWERTLLKHEKARSEINEKKIMMKFSYKPEDE